ncbi:MAG: hypothetical protein ACK5PP_07580 [Acidimicrobiales bacterium]
MEIILEPVVHLLGTLVSVAIGVGIGTLALVLIVVARRVIAHTSRSRLVQDPAGGWWRVGVVYGLRNPIGMRLTGMSGSARRQRRIRGVGDAAVEETELWHPRRILDAFDEAAGIAAPVVLAAAIGVVVVFTVELVIVAPVALAFLAYSAVRGRWQVELRAPDDSRRILVASSLSQARREAADVIQRIRDGRAPG